MKGERLFVGLICKIRELNADEHVLWDAETEPGREVLWLQSSTLSADVAVEHEPESLKEVCLSGVVFAYKAGNAVSDLHVEMPQIPKILDEDATDVHVLA